MSQQHIPVRAIVNHNCWIDCKKVSTSVPPKFGQSCGTSAEGLSVITPKQISSMTTLTLPFQFQMMKTTTLVKMMKNFRIYWLDRKWLLLHTLTRTCALDSIVQSTRRVLTRRQNPSRDSQ